MMPSFKNHVTEERRLLILQLLANSVGCEMNAYLLASQLDQLAMYLDELALGRELQWLADADLLRLRSIAGVTLAALTRQGLALTQGKHQVAGVARALPL